MKDDLWEDAKQLVTEYAAAMQISHGIVAWVIRDQSLQHQSPGKMCSAEFRVCISVVNLYICYTTKENKSNLGSLKR